MQPFCHGNGPPGHVRVCLHVYVATCCVCPCRSADIDEEMLPHLQGDEAVMHGRCNTFNLYLRTPSYGPAVCGVHLISCGSWNGVLFSVCRQMWGMPTKRKRWAPNNSRGHCHITIPALSAGCRCAQCLDHDVGRHDVWKASRPRAGWPTQNQRGCATAVTRVAASCGNGPTTPVAQHLKPFGKGGPRGALWAKGCAQ